MDINKSFGKFLAEHRKLKGLTQEQLGSKLYVTESAVSKWENDKSKPDISILKELANILDLTVDELISASINHDQRKEKKEAKKYRNIKITYNLFWLISFGITILVTFIVNLAVDHTLSWFFIVLSSLLLASSLLIIPQFIKKNKLRYIPLVCLGSLILLLGIISIYSKGDGWFYIVTFSLILFYSMVFTPLLIKTEKVPKLMKEYNALSSLTINAILLIILLGVINIYTNVVGNDKSFWFISIALPITLILLIPVYATTIILQTKKINWSFKTSITILIWTTVLNIMNPIVGLFVDNDSDTGYFWKANLKIWSTTQDINNNIFLIITLVFGTIAFVFMIVGVLKLKRLNKTIN